MKSSHNDYLLNYTAPARNFVQYYYEKETRLFTRSALIRRGEYKPIVFNIAVYDKEGNLLDTYPSVKAAAQEMNVSEASVRTSIKENKSVKRFFFRQYDADDAPDDNIEFDYVCEIDGIRFIKQVDAANYCGVTRQAVSFAKQKNAKMIGNKEVHWK